MVLPLFFGDPLFFKLFSVVAYMIFFIHKSYSFEEQLSYLPWDLSVKMLSNSGSSIAVVV